MADHLETPNLSKRALLAGAALAGAGIAASTGGIRERVIANSRIGDRSEICSRKGEEGDTLKIGYGQQALCSTRTQRRRIARRLQDLCDSSDATSK